jgi:hypothetical protein
MSTLRHLVYVHSEAHLKAYALVGDERCLKDPTTRHAFRKHLESSITAPYLLVLVEVDEAQTAAESVHAIYHSGETRKETYVGKPLQNMLLFFNEHLLPSGSLPERLDRYCGFFAAGDLEPLVMGTFSEASGILVSAEGDSLPQRVVDSFLIAAGSYAVTLQLLLDPEIFSSFPFSFTLPYISVGEDIWNTNLFQYLSYPASAIVSRSDSPAVRILCYYLVEFNNQWGPLFEEGPQLDPTPAMMDTMSGYMSMMSESMSNFSELEMRFQTASHNFYTELQDEIKEKLCREAESAREMVETIFEQRKSDFDAAIQQTAQETIEKFKDRFDAVIQVDLQSQLQKLECQLESKYEDRLRTLEKSVSTLFETQRKYFQSQTKCIESDPCLVQPPPAVDICAADPVVCRKSPHRKKKHHRRKVKH